MTPDTKRGRGRPKLAAETRRLDGVKLPTELYALVEGAAHREGVTVSEWVRAALHERLSRPRSA